MFQTKFTVRRGDDLIELEVYYRLTPRFPAVTTGNPEHWTPEYGGEIEELLMWDEDGTFIPTPREIEEIEQFIYARHECELEQEKMNKWKPGMQEMTILYLIAEGMSVKEIAARLNISAYAIQNIIQRMRKKIGTRTVSGLIAYAFRQKWIG